MQMRPQSVSVSPSRSKSRSQSISIPPSQSRPGVTLHEFTLSCYAYHPCDCSLGKNEYFPYTLYSALERSALRVWLHSLRRAQRQNSFYVGVAQELSRAAPRVVAHPVQHRAARGAEGDGQGSEFS
eukprot:gene16438-biopygen8250